MEQQPAAFPAVGHVYLAEYANSAFGAFAIEVTFDSPSHLSAVGTRGAIEGVRHSLDIATTPLRPGQFLVTWREADGTRVRQVEDFEVGMVHTNLVGPDRRDLVNLRSVIMGVLGELHAGETWRAWLVGHAANELWWWKGSARAAQAAPART
jgi:hypothetical protein